MFGITQTENHLNIHGKVKIYINYSIEGAQ